MDPYLLKRLWRRPWLSLCSLILSAVLCILMCFLSGYQQEQMDKLTETQESFEVLCVVSNVTGTQTTSLRLWSWAEYFVTSDEYDLHNYVKDLRMTKEYEATSFDLGVSQVLLTGVTNERCADRLNPAMGGGVTLFEEDFYESQEPLLLVSEELYGMLGKEDIFELSIKDPAISPEIEPDLGRGNVEFRIAGYYSGKGTDLYMPFPAAQAISVQISQKTHTDSIAFLAADNLKLEELSEAASLKFKTVDPLGTNSDGISAALTIHDEQYRATVAVLEQNIERTAYLLPVILLLSLGVGFLISFLATRGESVTYALMRTLGMTKGRLFASILREQMLLTVLAALAAALITKRYQPAMWYLLCHGIGCCIAVIRSVRVAPTAILREQE